MKHKEMTIEIKKEGDFYNYYDSNVMNENLSNYILHKTHGISYKTKINIKLLTGFKLTTNKKEEMVKLLHQNYQDILNEKTLQLNYMFIRIVFLLVIGLIFISTSFFIRNANLQIISELCLIVGWISIWETFYFIFFVDLRKRLENRRLKQLTKANVIITKIK